MIKPQIDKSNLEPEAWQQMRDPGRPLAPAALLGILPGSWEQELAGRPAGVQPINQLISTRTCQVPWEMGSLASGLRRG